MTTRQKRFLAAYIGPASFNRIRAARMAGVTTKNPASLHSIAWRLLNGAEVQAGIKAHLAHLHEQGEGRAQEFIAILTAIARAEVVDWTDIVLDEATGEERYVPNLEKAQALERIGVIKSIKQTSNGVEVVPHDKLVALKLLAQILGLVEQHVNLTVTHDEQRLRQSIMEKLDRASRFSLDSPGLN